MTTSRTDEILPVWDDARDVPFFRLTAHLFPPAFCLGAGTLLGTYDDEPVPVRRPAAGPPAAAGDATAGAPARTVAGRPGP